jgi:hypothetical protein
LGTGQRLRVGSRPIIEDDDGEKPPSEPEDDDNDHDTIEQRSGEKNPSEPEDSVPSPSKEEVRKLSVHRYC